MVMEVLSYISPLTLAATRAHSYHNELIVAPGVVFETAVIRPVHEPWINPGLVVRNVGIANWKTRRIDTVHGCSDHLAGIFAWPREQLTADDALNWYVKCPKSFKPTLPSDFLKGIFPNIVFHGEEAGWAGMFNTTVLLDTSRRQLAGSEVGSAIAAREYPFICAFPLSGEEAKTTNQGKTSFTTIVGRMINPDLPVLTVPDTGSAPDNRTLVKTIINCGTLIADEFVLTEMRTNVLCKANIQSLCTGGTVGAGLANENITGFKIKNCLLASSKFANFPPDLLARSVPTTLDVFDKSKPVDHGILSAIETGLAAQVGRLSALAWMEEDKFVAKVKATKLGKGNRWRFTAHATVSGMFATEKQIDAYIDASLAQCERQLREAEDTGLKEALGVRVKLDPEYYFREANETTIQRIYLTLQNARMRTSELLRVLVEDGAERRLSIVLKEYFIKEKTAQHLLSSSLLKAPYVRQGWRLSATATFVEVQGRKCEEVIYTLDAVDDNGTPIPFGKDDKGFKAKAEKAAAEKAADIAADVAAEKAAAERAAADLAAAHAAEPPLPPPPEDEQPLPPPPAEEEPLPPPPPPPEADEQPLPPPPTE
jgi:hypothetical protein